MPADHLYIVRHGDTKANVKGIDAGPMDFPLTKKGVKDVEFIARTLSKIKMSAVFSSPVFRAVETAKILARPHDLKVKTMGDLTEAKLKAQFIGKKGRHHILTDPAAYTETIEDLLERTGRAIDAITKKSDGNVIVVSHGDVICAILDRVIERRVTDKRYYVAHPDPGSLSIIDVRSGPFLKLYNYHRKMFAEY